MESDPEGYETDEVKQAQKKKPKLVYEKKISKSHEEEFKDWLVADKDGKTGKCSVCNAQLKGGKTEFKRHSETKLHGRNMTAKSLQPSVAAFVPQTEKVKQVENAMCAFLAEHDLPISFIEPLVEFCKELPEKNTLEKIQLGKQKATNIIRQGLRPYFNSQLVNELDRSFFSVFIDECTDVTSKSQLAVVVSYYSLESKSTEVDVIDVTELHSATAEGTYNTMMEVLVSQKINLNNWVGFCADTTAVMMGPNNSVARLIRKNYPQVIVVKCSCHSIHLVASYACQKLSTSLEDLCRTIYNHFKRSPKRQRELIQFQQFLNPDEFPKKLLAPGQTRWLSLQSCVRRILENWDALKSYWELLVFEDKTHANEQVLTTLKNPLLKCLMEFVEYALGLFNTFNTFFQSDAPQFGLLKTKVEELLKILALNFMKASYVRGTSAFQIDPHSTNHYMELKDVYLGVAATSTLFELKDAEPSEVEKLHRSAREFYVEGVNQIKSRFQFSDTDHFKDAEFLSPDNARNLKPRALFTVAKKYMNIQPEWKFDLSKLNEEWRERSILSNEKTDMHEYWKIVIDEKDLLGNQTFPELARFVSVFFSLPFSNALTERLFSCMKNVKSPKRNRLNNETLSSLLCVKYGVRRTKKIYKYFLKNKLPHKIISEATATASKQLRQTSLAELGPGPSHK